MADVNVEELTLEQLRGAIESGAHPPHIVHHLQRFSSTKSPGSTTSSAPYTSPTRAISDDSHSSGGPARFDFSLSFTKLAQQRNKDGEKPKRRGPKPDSKPALTRRQELNRQAQRTHRERKERYVKSLEEEVVRLREAFVLVTKEKTRMQDENRAMKQLLDAHGISYGANPESSIINSQNSHLQHNHNHNHSQLPHQSRFTLHDQTGIDFVLALEQPCMKHMRFLTNATVNDNHDNAYHGHALMLSCPPECHNLKNPEIDWGLKTYDLPVSDLVKLFNLSQRLQLNGELTPIAVWAYIASLEQFPELELGDFEMLKQELLPKVTCHGFGAVVGEEHVHAAVDKLLISRFGPAMSC